MAPSNRNCYNSSESVSDADVSAVEEVHYIGVRERQPGRYVSEIRDPSTKSKRRWLGTFNSSEEAARAYDNAARAMRGAKAKTNFPAPSLQLDSAHNQSCTTATTTLHSAPPLNKNMTSTRSAFGSQVKPWAYVNELEVGMGGKVGYHNTIAPTKTLMGVSLSEENVGFQIQKGPHPMGVSLSEENVGFLIQKELPGLGVRPVNNVLPAAETSIFCDLSSSSGVVDTRVVDTQFSVSPPKKKNTMTRSFDLNLPVPLEDDDDDEREPSLSLSLGFDFPKNSWFR